MKNKIPENVQKILIQFVKIFQDYLGDKLAGIYLHGSLAMGVYNPSSSDIDILVVVKNDLTLDEKKYIGLKLVSLVKKAPPHGFEMSILTLNTLTHFTYPTPYELHFSDSNKQDFFNGNIDLMKQKTDPDLAAHCMITKKRGSCLFGEPIQNIFPDVPLEYYFDSIKKDSEWSYNNIIKGPDSGRCDIPVYAVLNFCRVLGFIKERLIISKLEGGQWGIKNVPDEYSPIIREACREYEKSGSSIKIDSKLLKRFAIYSMNIISKS